MIPLRELGSNEAIAFFMAIALNTSDPGCISHALGVVAQAMTQIVRETGLWREQLYRSFSEKGNATMKTSLAVMKALRVKLTTVRPWLGTAMCIAEMRTRPASDSFESTSVVG